MAETIRIDTDARGVATIWLARPDKHNAMSAQMMDELSEAAHTLDRDALVRVVVLAAEGRSFCAGGDLGWMQAQIDADVDAKRAEARRLADMLWSLNCLSKPLIGRIHGNAFGGGVGLASVCDVAIGATDLKMGLTETKLGLIPATIGPYVVARMGEAKARRVFMSSRVFGAQEAMALGLLSKVVTPEDLDDAIEAEVLPYLACAPGAVADAKAMVRALAGSVTQDMVERSIEALVKRWDSAESVEGLAAFFEKRDAYWVTGK